MPGCSGALAAASMTGSTELGPIQPQQDSAAPLLLDERLFADGPPSAHSRLPPPPPPTPAHHRRRMTHTPAGQPVQLTPLWEYVVRTKKFPKDASVAAVFDEISTRLRDPEWEVRQHALRVLVDVLPTFGPDSIDEVAGLVLPDLVANLGNPAPAVRKGSLDALRIYLLHSPRRDEITRKILQEGMGRADPLDDYQSSVATGVILATPLLLFPSRSGSLPSSSVVREASQALAMRLVQVTHQESALRSLARIRETVGQVEFDRYLGELDDTMRRNFQLLCEVYGLDGSHDSASSSARRRRPRSKATSAAKSQRRRRDSLEDSIKDVVPVDKSWDSEDSDTSGIAEEDEDGTRVSSSASASSARVVLETEIKFDEETAITMTILEEQDDKSENKPESEEDTEAARKDGKTETVKALPEPETPEEETLPEERRKTPKRVHFGGEIVKLRTPDSEDAESVLSIDLGRQLLRPHTPSPAPRLVPVRVPAQQLYQHQQQQQQQQQQPLPRTRIPLPVSPATRMPRRPRSSSQPNPARRPMLHRIPVPRRSASSSPSRRELQYTHRPDLSPKKSILARAQEVDRMPSPLEAASSSDSPRVDSRKSRTSRRDSILSPRIVVEEAPEPSFRICEEPSSSPTYGSPQPELSDYSSLPHSPSPALLGDVCTVEEETTLDSIFGDRSGTAVGSRDKMRKDQENRMRSVYRSRSALDHVAKFDWNEKDEENAQGRGGRRIQSAKGPGFEVFPRQERNYILMELSSPVKDRSRRTSLEDDDSVTTTTITMTTVTTTTTTVTLTTTSAESSNDNATNNLELKENIKENEKANGENENSSKDTKDETEEKAEEKTEEPQVDSNKLTESEKVEEDGEKLKVTNTVEDERLDIVEEDLEKAALDAKERSSDSSSDGEWKHKEPSWEELGLVDDEILKDFHNKDDWRARVRGLERIASALRVHSALETLEPRLGSLLLAILGGEKSSRVAAAGLAVARVVLTGVSEEVLKNRMPLIAWGLARQGGPNAAQLARLTMLRTSPGLFLEKLLQPQCIGSRNAKTRENTLQLLIFSLVTFPSTEFKVKCAIDKVVAMVADRRKRVRHSALDTLAVLSQIYESEDILEASKRFTKGKQDGSTIHAAIKTRLSRKLLPTVSVDGLVVYGLQISSNAQNTGADVEWIIAGSGSVSPGTGRTRGQLITMSKTENELNEQNNTVKKSKVRPASEHSISSVASSAILEKDERISSWKLLSQTDENDKPRKKIDRTSKSANVSKVNNLIFENQNEEILEKETKIQKPYATPKRAERKAECQVSSDFKQQSIKETEEFLAQGRGSLSAPPPRLESRIPVYTGTKTTILESNKEGQEKNSSEDTLRMDVSSHLTMNQRRKINAVKSAVPRTNYINYAHINRYINPQFEKSRDDIDSDSQVFKDNYKGSIFSDFKENSQRVLSHEKLNKSFDSINKISRGLKSSPHYHYTSKITETYETVYQRQRRSKDEKVSRPYGTAPGHYYDHAYEYYMASRKIPTEGGKNTKRSSETNQNPQKRSIFTSPFDNHPFGQSTEIPDKDNPELGANGNLTRTTSNSSKSTTSPSDRGSSPRHDGGEARCSSGSSSSSNRSAPSARRLRGMQTLSAHTESDESNGLHDHGAAGDKAFDVIDAPEDVAKEAAAASFDSEDEEPQQHPGRLALRRGRRSSSANSSSDRLNERAASKNNFGRSRSALSIDKATSPSTLPPALLPIERRLSTADGNGKHSLESLLMLKANGSVPKATREEIRLPALPCNGYVEHSSSVKSSPDASRSSSEGAFSARCSSSRSMMELNGMNDPEDEKETTSESPEEEEERRTADFRSGTSREPTSATSAVNVVVSPARARPTYDCGNDLPNTDSNGTLYSCNSVTTSPKSSSPKRFVSDLSVRKDTDDSDETPPVPIGFGSDADRLESSDGSDESDELGAVKPQSRLPTPIDLPRRLCKVSPCRMKPQPSCHRPSLAPVGRHHEKHPEKLSKLVQQCFFNLESKDWEMTLKGLRTLAQLARDEPEQLDVCAPGLLLRVLGKHVKNLRSQVARVACATTGDVFSAHIRGIDQDLDEIAGPLLHRTADTNRFLREDCNIALDSMIEHFPPHRTIMTIANRGANHQNTIVHATTARLLYAIVSEIGPECAMLLQRDVRDKLFATTAKLLTDGNLQARKHAKETFRLLMRCEGFRKALTDAVPESTLRLIDKTLRTL